VSDETWLQAVRAAAGSWPAIERGSGWFLPQAEAARARGGALPAHLADLYLARAVAAADAVALRIFDDRVLPRIDHAVRRIDGSPAFVDELRQVLRVHLLVGDAGAAPRIAAYQGRGPLVAWVRVVAVRAALNLKRAERPTVSEDERLVELVDREPDPGLRHVKALYRAEYDRALREALAALPDRQRVLLRLHFFDGLRLARIAALYGVHESTASRWVSGAVSAIATATERRLRERLSLSPATLDSVARMVVSGLELSMRRLLGGGGSAAGP
jgi:RNA polymerase sigma-70 factor (ECF subfamily)